MDKQKVKAQIDTLAKLITLANKEKAAASPRDFGACRWTDSNGDARCNDGWSEFQCQQAAGQFTPGGSC